MSFQSQSFIDFSAINSKDIYSLFDIASSLKPYSRTTPKNACLIFLEPSTRTQLSFEVAARDCGVQTSIFQTDNSSLKKGETLLDTLFTAQAIGFDLFVIRHGLPGENLKKISQEISVPIINAGEGVSGHPTQALLDAYTILQEKKKLENEKVLFIGDIKHSRVVSSNIELLKILGVEVALCAPEEFLPAHSSGVKIFKKLNEALDWATVAMALRTQLERHQDGIGEKIKKDFIQNFSLNPASLKNFRSDGLIMHPGPFNREIEIASEVLKDPRCRIFKQVENGRKIRRALIHSILGEK